MVIGMVDVAKINRNSFENSKPTQAKLYTFTLSDVVDKTKAQIEYQPASVIFSFGVLLDELVRYAQTRNEENNIEDKFTFIKHSAIQAFLVAYATDLDYNFSLINEKEIVTYAVEEFKSRYHSKSSLYMFDFDVLHIIKNTHTNKITKILFFELKDTLSDVSREKIAAYGINRVAMLREIMLKYQNKYKEKINYEEIDFIYVVVVPFSKEDKDKLEELAEYAESQNVKIAFINMHFIQEVLFKSLVKLFNSPDEKFDIYLETQKRAAFLQKRLHEIVSTVSYQP